MHHRKFGALQLMTAFLSLAILLSGCRSCGCSAAGTAADAGPAAAARANQCPFFRSVLISIRLSDDGFASKGCNGTNPGSLSTTKINCHL
jgi:hypothetical protein